MDPTPRPTVLVETTTTRRREGKFGVIIGAIIDVFSKKTNRFVDDSLWNRPLYGKAVGWMMNRSRTVLRNNVVIYLLTKLILC